MADKVKYLTATPTPPVNLATPVTSNVSSLLDEYLKKTELPNTSTITTINSRINTLENTSDSTLTSKVTVLEADLKALEQESCDHKQKINTLEDAVLWTPRLMNTSLWLDADDEGILTDQGKVTAWADPNNLLSLTQTVANDRPAYEHKCILDNEVAFDSSDSLSVIPDSQPTSDASGEYLIVMVLESQDKSNSDVFSVQSGNQSLKKVYVSNENINCKTENGTVCDTPAGTDYSVLSFLQASEALSIHAGGDLKKSVAHITSDFPDITAITLGSGSFKIKELVYLNWRTCTGDRQTLEGYLAHKWGYEEELFDSHPYKKGPPVKLRDQITCGYGFGQ